MFTTKEYFTVKSLLLGIYDLTTFPTRVRKFEKIQKIHAFSSYYLSFSTFLCTLSKNINSLAMVNTPPWLYPTPLFICPATAITVENKFKDRVYKHISHPKPIFPIIVESRGQSTNAYPFAQACT